MAEETIKLRDYQIELYYEIQKRKSCILFLPAGSGKTHIAFWLIQSMSADLKKPVSDGGKRTFFLGLTKQLVEQQAAVLSRLGNFEVILLTGDSRVDNFNKEKWHSLERDNEVFVMTTQVYLDALSYAYLSIENANLVVFDECHHATGNHAMVQVLNHIRSCNATRRPKILGLSATLLNANVKFSEFNKKLRELETVFDGEIITSNKCKEIRDSYSAKPTETIKTCSTYDMSPSTLNTLTNLRNIGVEVLNVVKLKANAILSNAERTMIQLHKPGSNRCKLLQGVLRDILVHVEQYGLYMGYTCCQCYIIELYRHMFVSHEQNYVNMMLYTVNLAQMMRKVLFMSILERSGCSEDDFQREQTIIKTSSGKLEHVFERLRALKWSDKCIIFVQKKLTAKSLYKIIRIFIEEHPNYELKVDFIIGSATNPLRNTREGFHQVKQQKHIIDRFRRGEINVLVATDVLEEGIDIQQCNLVIMFDPIKTFRSYIQSKGRARMKGSEYIIVNDLETRSLETKIAEFRNIDQQLDHVIEEKNILDDDADESMIPVFDRYTTQVGGEITNISAVSRIYMYCSVLPRDLFTDLVPYWFYDPKTRSCTLTLPLNAGIPFAIQGPPRSNRKEAKQAVALEGIRQLHQLKLIDDHLVPKRVPQELIDTDYWFPNWDTKDDAKLKTVPTQDLSFTTNLRVPKYFKNCRPLPDTKCYLHIIRTKTAYQMPKIQRQIFCHELMQVDAYEYGFLTREPLPPICEFPTYTDLGEVRVKIEVNAACLELTKQQVENVSQFHRNLFLYVLEVVPKCYMYDTEGESNGYFLVPLKQVQNTVEIAWKCVKKKFEADVTRPSEAEIGNQVYSTENYIAKVVTPWYTSNLRYIVVDVSNSLHLNSEFNLEFATYREYFEKTYGLTPLRPAQPLLHVRPISKNLDGILPKPVSASQKNRKKCQDHDIYLPPEYCHIFSFPSVYWYKATILPSVLHRIHHLLLAEELRERIVIEAQVGTAILPLDDGETVQCFKKRTQPQINQSSCLPRTQRKAHALSGNVLSRSTKTEDGEIKIKDIERELVVNMVDIKQYADYIETPLVSQLASRSSDLSATTGRNVTINFVESPKLMTLNEPSVEHGPQAHQILEALTLGTAADALNLERLETLGDSVLKFLVSFSTFVKCKRMNEGHLTVLKGQLVSNQNLFYCGRKLDIESYVKGVNFSAKTSWCPPGFTIPSVLKNQFTGEPLSSLLAATVPKHEQFSGYINAASIERMLKTDVADYIKNLEEKDETLEKQINFYFGRQEMRRKNVSDVVEALLGIYSKTCGIRGAFKLLKFFGVLSKENLDELLRAIPSAGVCSLNSIERLLPDYRSIERLCGYKFKNRLYLLQAFTHPSFKGLDVTDCYQKLEFIGDAILDFLITSYIFEYGGDLTPGQLTDLRMSLVNNNTFGALAVRLRLHKYLKYHSNRLMDAIDSFVAYQDGKNDEIHGNEMMTLINEDDTTVAEEVDVPKTLGDIFESLARAVYLDSGCDLSAVWTIYYNFMKDELEKFSKNVPKNPVRVLHERISCVPGGKVVFSQIDPKEAPNVDKLINRKKILLRIIGNKQTHEYVGRGETLKSAKRAAAKFALRDLNYNEFVI